MSTTRTDLVLGEYIRGERPAFADSLPIYLDSELQRIEQAIRDLVEAAPQVADVEPERPRKGMIRHAVSPWNPLGTGDGWVYWDGSQWKPL